MMPEQEARRGVVSTPGILGGRPCIDGTRIPAGSIANLWHDGYSVARILEEYPDLTADDVVTALGSFRHRPALERPKPS